MANLKNSSKNIKSKVILRKNAINTDKNWLLKNQAKNIQHLNQK